jgi:citrate lyase subunit beta / citryl-CoA lyase
MRSMLFVPGDSERKFQKAMGIGADALILDLEDSVAAEQKPAARGTTAGMLREARAQADRPKLFVRINALDTSFWSDDLAAVMPAQPDGIVLPKPTSGEDVNRLAVALDHAEQPAATPKGSTKILPIVTEVAKSVLLLHSYIDASSRMNAMSWGAEDLGSQIGSSANRGPDGDFTSPYRLVRDLCLITAVAAEAQPIDTVFVNFRDEAGLVKESREAARDGFTGKIAIHPAQVAPINAAFTPSADEIARAERIVEVFAADPTSGVASLDGEMLDRPHLVLAERLLARARAAGL